MMCYGVFKVKMCEKYQFHVNSGSVRKSKWAQWVQNGYVAHLHAEKNKKNLIWCESPQWLMSYGGYKVQMCKNYPFQTNSRPVRMSRSAEWIQNGYVAHLQAKTNPKNLIWCESAQWLMSYGGYKVQMCKKYQFQTKSGRVRKSKWAEWIQNGYVAHI